MKQNITRNQVDQLSEKAKKRLDEFPFNGCYDVRCYEDICVPLPSIGQMIEFLDQHYPISMIGHQSEWHGGNYYFNGGTTPKDPTEESIKNSTVKYEAKELCDALWEAVKEVLERD